MTKVEKVKFVRDLTANILADVERKIAAELIPETWDGHELRQWLSDKFENSAGTMTPRRCRDFRNECIVRNL